MAQKSDVPSAIDAHLGGRLRVLRQERGWSKATLAGVLELSIAELSALENGKRRISAPLLMEFCGRLEVSLGHFFAVLDGRPYVRSPRKADALDEDHMTLELIRAYAGIASQQRRELLLLFKIAAESGSTEP